MVFQVCLYFFQYKRELTAFHFFLKENAFSAIQYILTHQDAGCLYRVPGVLLCRNKANHVVSYKCRGPPGFQFIL